MELIWALESNSRSWTQETSWGGRWLPRRNQIDVSFFEFYVNDCYISFPNNGLKLKFLVFIVFWTYFEKYNISTQERNGCTMIIRYVTLRHALDIQVWWNKLTRKFPIYSLTSYGWRYWFNIKWHRVKVRLSRKIVRFMTLEL